MIEKTLGQIFNDCGSDKESGHGYGESYEYHLPKKINKLLEIGCWQGAGITAFKQYYKDEGEFYALDRFLEGHRLITEGELQARGINALKGDHDDFVFLYTIKEQFSVIIEDGSHHFDSQINIFKIMFVKNLESGGVYVIEDIFDDLYWGRGLIKDLKQNIKGLLTKFKNEGNIIGDYITPKESEVICSMIDELFIYDNIIFIKKK